MLPRNGQFCCVRHCLRLNKHSPAQVIAAPGRRFRTLRNSPSKLSKLALVTRLSSPSSPCSSSSSSCFSSSSSSLSPSFSSSRSHLCGEVVELKEGDEVALCGWLQSSRNLGPMYFGVISDWSGTVQFRLDKKDTDTDDCGLYSAVSSCRLHSVIRITGTVQKRPPEMVKLDQKAGGLEIIVSSYKLLNESVGPPISMHVSDNVEVADSHVDKRLRYRYLDLRGPVLQRVLRIRSKISHGVRQCMDENGFVEVETPILFKSTPEGASEFVVPTRKPGKFFALPQSPQQLKQMLMVGGVDKYYQIARCFRDEGGRTDRQPEFTQIDIEQSFVSVEDVMQTTERLLQSLLKVVAPHTCHTPVHFPLPRLTYRSAMDRYGSDKPDLRYELQLQDVTELIANHTAGIPVFASVLEQREAGLDACIKAINAKGLSSCLSRKELDGIVKHAKLYGAQGLAVIRVSDDGEWKLAGGLKALVEEPVKQELIKKLQIEPGGVVLLGAGQWTTCCNFMGAVRIHLRHVMSDKGLLTLDKNQLAALWVTEFPLFEDTRPEDSIESHEKDSEDSPNRLVASHHPFTSPEPDAMEVVERVVALMQGDGASSPRSLNELLREDTQLLNSLLQCKGLCYDVVINGMEVGGGSIRIHRSQLQKKVLAILGSKEEHFSHLLQALDLGCPPHGGIALGLDRIVAILASEGMDALSIRDVIAFPKSVTGNDLLAESPCAITNEQLATYNIATTEDQGP